MLTEQEQNVGVFVSNDPPAATPVNTNSIFDGGGVGVSFGDPGIVPITEGCFDLSGNPIACGSDSDPGCVPVDCFGVASAVPGPGQPLCGIPADCGTGGNGGTGICPDGTPGPYCPGSGGGSGGGGGSSAGGGWPGFIAGLGTLFGSFGKAFTGGAPGGQAQCPAGYARNLQGACVNAQGVVYKPATTATGTILGVSPVILIGAAVLIVLIVRKRG